MRVAVDFDETLADSRGAIMQLNGNDEWLPQDEFIELSDQIWRNGHTVNPLGTDTAYAFRRLTNLFHVDIVTACPVYEKTRIEWLRRHSIVGWDSYIISENKASLNYDVYIDDHPEMGVDLQYMIKRDWNEHKWDDPNIVPVDSLREAVGKIVW